MSFNKILVSAALMAALLLSGCGNEATVTGPEGEEIKLPRSVEFAAGKLDTDVTELSIALEEGEAEQLKYFTNLQTADFTGSACLEDIKLWAEENPQVEVYYTVTLPDGTVLDTESKSADLSLMDGDGVRKAAESLSLLPELRSIELGYEREELSWDDIGVLQQACPDVKIKYYFELYGKEVYGI